LVQPYGFVADVGSSSGKGGSAAGPYTVAEEENTKDRTSCAVIASTSESVEPMLLR
jgi:hypothetical protein